MAPREQDRIIHGTTIRQQNPRVRVTRCPHPLTSPPPNNGHERHTMLHSPRTGDHSHGDHGPPSSHRTRRSLIQSKTTPRLDRGLRWCLIELVEAPQCEPVVHLHQFYLDAAGGLATPAEVSDEEYGARRLRDYDNEVPPRCPIHQPTPTTSLARPSK